MNNTLLEILQTKEWMLSPDYLHNARRVIEQNIAGHVPYQAPDKIASRRIDPLAAGANINNTPAEGQASQQQQFVNVMYVDGPITRNGGACSYGSYQHREEIFQAANTDGCIGHVFVIDTPGGSAWAKNDYQQAIEYARSKGQPVIAFIDGLCASAGMYLAALCDEVYYMHPKDQIGCIGVMAAFHTSADGEHNDLTGETYHELYDPESFDKNREYRDIANDNDTKLYVKSLAELGAEFRADVSRAFPAATDEHLHGRVFSCGEVKGILCDGQKSFTEVLSRVADLAGGAAPVERLAPKKNKSNDNNKESNMNNEIIANALGVEAFEVNEQGAVLNEQQAQALADLIEAHRAEMATASEQIAALQAAAAHTAEENTNSASAAAEEHNAAIAALNEEHAAAVAALNEEHTATLAELRAEHTTALNDVEANFNHQLEEAHAATAALQSQLDAANQAIADRDAQIATLTTQAAEQHDAAPANNGIAPSAPLAVNAMPEYNPNLSPLENQRIRREFLANKK